MGNTKMYLIEVKYRDNKVVRKYIDTPQELGKFIHDNMKVIGYVKILEEIPSKTRKRTK